MIEEVVIRVGQPIRVARALEIPIPSAVPARPPRADRLTASSRNWRRMSRVRAPTAMRRPISRVRSVTETSMMFMIPIPPTSRLTEATLMSRPVMVWASCTRVWAISSTVRTVKSSSSGFWMRWRWRRMRVTSTAVASTFSGRSAEIMIWRR